MIEVVTIVIAVLAIVLNVISLAFMVASSGRPR